MDKKFYLLAELDDILQMELKILEKVIAENGIIGKQTKDIPYHITLSSYSLDNEYYLENLLEDIKGKFTEINISFNSLGLFGLNVLFMNPIVNMELIKIYNFAKEKSFEKDNDLVAHTTLLIDEPENIIKILPKIVENCKIFSGKIKYISLYEFFPKKLIKRIELKEE